MSEDPNPVDVAGGGTPAPDDGPPAGPDALPGLWARVVDLEREARFLAAKCDDLRHGCRGMMRTVGQDGPLTADQTRAILAVEPRLTFDEIAAAFERRHAERYGPRPPAPPEATVAELTRRAAEGSARVAELAAERAALRVPYLALANAIDPFVPPTPEEIAEMIRVAEGPPGPSLLDLIAEVERGTRP